MYLSIEHIRDSQSILSLRSADITRPIDELHCNMPLSHVIKYMCMYICIHQLQAIRIGINLGKSMTGQQTKSNM